MIKEYITLKVKDIIPYEKNPRKNDNAVPDVAESIKQVGYITPIVIDENNVILCGHTRLKALKRNGETEVDGVLRVSGLTDEQKRKYRLLDNKTGEAAEWDFDLLSEELAELDFDGFDFGWDISDTEEVGKDETPQKLADKFIVPPFDILDGKTGDWLNRKRAWNEKINDKAQARFGAKSFNNAQTNDKEKYKGNGTMPNETSILDPVLSEIILKWFAPNNPKCFDCFAGDTVFGYVCSSLGGSFTGIELRQEQCDFNQNACIGLQAKYICDDGRNVLNHIEEKSQDLLFSCPPYFDLEVYSDLENDASNQETYEDFYKIIDEAFINAIKCLKDNRFAVIVCGDIRSKKDGSYYNFPNDIINTFKKQGLLLYNNIKLLTPFGTAQIRAGKYMKNRKTVHVYQDVLVFYKGDTKKIKDIFGDVEVAEIESEDLESQKMGNLC